MAFNVNPLMSEWAGVSPGLKGALATAHQALSQPADPTQAISPDAGQPSVLPPGTLMQQPDAGPPENITLPESTPTLSMPSSQPKVEAPRGTITGDTNARGKLLSEGPPADSIYSKVTNAVPGFGGKLLGGIAQVGGKIGDTLANGFPGLAKEIPGTTVRHNMLVNQANTALTQDEASAEKQAQTAGFQQKGDLEEQQARAAELTPTTEDESTALGVPVGTMLNAASRAALSKQTGINNTKIQTTGMTVQGKQDVTDANNLTKEKVAQLKPEQRDDHAIRIMELPPNQRTQQDNAYLAAYSRWVDQTKTQPGIARAQAFGAFRPVQTIDPSTGDVHYSFAGNAIKSGASSPGSMNFRTALGMSRYMTSGKGGGFITAYNTTNDHLDLLGKAMDALQNGDVQGLNQLNNLFKQQFGSAAPTNVNAVKAMLAGELGNVAKVTGATDPEIKEQRDNINRASSPEQIKGFIETNHDLMDQKAYEMYQQYQSGMQGKPAFGTGRPLKGPGNNTPAQGGAPPQRPAGVPEEYEYNPQGNGGKGSWREPPKP